MLLPDRHNSIMLQQDRLFFVRSKVVYEVDLFKEVIQVSACAELFEARRV